MMLYALLEWQLLMLLFMLLPLLLCPASPPPLPILHLLLLCDVAASCGGHACSAVSLLGVAAAAVCEWRR